MTDMSNVEFIRDLAARMFRNATPAMGFDQGDTDRLYVIANRLAVLEQAGEPGADRQAREIMRPQSGSAMQNGPHAQSYGMSEIQRLGQEFDAAPIKQPLTTAADASLPQRKDCKCVCHKPGVAMLHVKPCCRNDEPAADAGVTQRDKKLLAHIVSWVHCPAIMSVDQVEQMIAAHRLQSVAAATAAKDAEIIKRLNVARDKMEVTSKHQGLGEDQIANIWGVMSGIDAAISIIEQISALSEAREAGNERL